MPPLLLALLPLHHMQLTTCIAVLALTCASTAGPMPDADEIFLDKHLPGVVLGSGEDEPTTGDWLPLREQSQRFQMAGHPDRQFTVSTLPTVRDYGKPVGSSEGGWMLVANRSFIAHLHQEPDGSLFEPTQLSHDLGLLIRLNPPEPLLLTEAKPGKSIERHVRVRMYDLHEPAVLAHSGDRRLTYTDMGMWRVKVPAGTWNARLVRLQGENNIAGQTFQSLRYVFFVRDVGIVAMIDTKPVTEPIHPVGNTHAAVLVSTGPVIR